MKTFSWHLNESLETSHLAVMCYIDNVVVFHCAQAYWVLSNVGQITRMVLQAKRGGPGLSTNEYLVVLAKFVYFCLIISFF